MSSSSSSGTDTGLNSTGLNSTSLAFQQLLLHQYQVSGPNGTRVMALPRILRAWSDLLKERAAKVARAATALEINIDDGAAELMSISEPGSAIPDSDLQQILMALPILPPDERPPPEDEDADARAEEDAAIESLGLTQQQLAEQRVGEPIPEADVDAGAAALRAQWAALEK